MKKFSTLIIIFLAIVGAVAINGWRGAGGRFDATTAELITTSNKLAEATAKLAEQGAATETLRVQLNLQKSDLAAASNHVGALSGQIKQAAAQTRELQDQLQSRSSEIATLSHRKSELEAKHKHLQAQTTALQSALGAAQAQSAETAKRVEAVNAALNESESEKAALLAKLGDPPTLRACLKSATAPTAGPRPRGKEPLVLNPDGSVGFALPAFPEPPPPNNPSPKLRL